MAAQKKATAARAPSAKQLDKKLNDGLKDMTDKLDRVVASTNDAIGGINEKFDTLMSTLNGGGPALIRKTFEPMEQSFGPDESTEFVDGPEGEIVLAKPGQDVGDRFFKEKQDELAFMEEKVHIFIQDSTDPNAEQVFAIHVSGKPFIFERGKEFVAPRKYLEGLARAKPVHFSSQEFVNRVGDKAYRYPAHKSPRYPFSVVKDPNPRGHAWLSSVLKQP